MDIFSYFKATPRANPEIPPEFLVPHERSEELRRLLGTFAASREVPLIEPQRKGRRIARGSVSEVYSVHESAHVPVAISDGGPMVMRATLCAPPGERDEELESMIAARMFAHTNPGLDRTGFVPARAYAFERQGNVVEWQEYMPHSGVDMGSYLRKIPEEEHGMRALRCLLLGALRISSLHELGYTHGDIGLGNLLVSEREGRISVRWSDADTLNLRRDVQQPVRMDALDKLNPFLGITNYQYAAGGELARDDPKSVRTDIESFGWTILAALGAEHSPDAIQQFYAGESTQILAERAHWRKKRCPERWSAQANYPGLAQVFCNAVDHAYASMRELATDLARLR